MVTLYISIREACGSNINWIKMPQGADRVVYFCPNLYAVVSYAIMPDDFRGSLQSLPAISGILSPSLSQEAFFQIIPYLLSTHTAIRH